MISLSGPGWLILAILSEVLAPSSLKMAEGFTRPVPSAVVILGYALASTAFRWRCGPYRSA